MVTVCLLALWSVAVNVGLHILRQTSPESTNFDASICSEDYFKNSVQTHKKKH